MRATQSEPKKIFVYKRVLEIGLVYYAGPYAKRQRGSFLTERTVLVTEKAYELDNDDNYILIEENTL